MCLAPLLPFTKLFQMDCADLVGEEAPRLLDSASQPTPHPQTPGVQATAVAGY